MTARDVFISHSSADAETARELKRLLEAAGYSSWIAPDDVIGTETWTEQILAAIDGSQVALVLVSAAANKSVHVSREVNLALGKGRPVLPVRIEPVAPEGSLEYLLSLVQRVDAFPPPISTHRDQIIRRLEGVIGPRTPMQAPGPATPPAPTPTPTPATDDSPDAPTKGRPRRRAPGSRQAAGIGPGSTVGGFTIEAVLGEGGMATVYRARQSEPNRAVALKVIRSDHSKDPTYRRRFLAEKETLASLEHPSIVPIYAAGDDDGVLYIAMRLIDGVDLGTRIANQGRLSIRETVEVLRPIADALDHAHELGVLHRDLKPANVILDRRGRPYLTDFAIGERASDASGSAVAGIVMGTAEYLSPEQAAGRPDAEIGPAIDVYALGCIAYACLHGQPPFVRPTPEVVLAAHVSETPASLRALHPEIPTVLDELVAKALAKDPAARFATAGEFVSGLELVAVAASQGTTQPVVLPESRTPEARARRWFGANIPVAVIGGALGVIVLVVGAVAVLKPGPQASPSPTAAGPTAVLPTATIKPTQAPATPTPGPPANHAPVAVNDPISFPNSTYSYVDLALMDNDLDTDLGSVIGYKDWTIPDLGTIEGVFECQLNGRTQYCLRYRQGLNVGPYVATFYYRIADELGLASDYGKVTVTFGNG